MDIKNQLIDVTAEYFNDNLDFVKLSNATKEFKSILTTLSGEKLQVDEGRNDLEFDNGKALGTFWAALCLDDMLRTRQFIRGINEAINDKLKSQKQLHILYAGSGPFATLLLPIMLRFSKLNIKYTLLEINPLSIQILKNVIHKMGLEEYDISIVNEDATLYKFNPNHKPDIIISETMQNALAKEQQVPIFLNLMRQAKEDAVFIPEKIELHLGLKEKGISEDQFQTKHHLKINKVFELSKEAMFHSSTSKVQINGIDAFEKLETVLSNEKLVNYEYFVIITEIDIYNKKKIGINDSGLTTPIIIEAVPQELTGFTMIETQYIISAEPKLEYMIKQSSLS